MPRPLLTPRIFNAFVPAAALAINVAVVPTKAPVIVPPDLDKAFVARVPCAAVAYVLAVTLNDVPVSVNPVPAVYVVFVFVV